MMSHKEVSQTRRGEQACHSPFPIIENVSRLSCRTDVVEFVIKTP